MRTQALSSPWPEHRRDPHRAPNSGFLCRHQHPTEDHKSYVLPECQAVDDCQATAELSSDPTGQWPPGGTVEPAVLCRAGNKKWGEAGLWKMLAGFVTCHLQHPNPNSTGGAWSSELLIPKVRRTNRLRGGSCKPRMIGTPILGLLLPCQACQLQPHLAEVGERRFARRMLRLRPRPSQTSTNEGISQNSPHYSAPLGTLGVTATTTLAFLQGVLGGGRSPVKLVCPAQG